MRQVQIISAFLICLLTWNNKSVAQTNTASDTLYREIRNADSILFNAFNNRDLNKFKSFFTEDLEFYHDKGGLTGYKHTIDFMKSVAAKEDGLKRELVIESLEVYPIPGYGAMEMGVHRFCHLEKGKKECGAFKFVHIWKKTGNQWKITRVVSYAH